VLFVLANFRFLEGLDEGVFIQQTVESVLQNDDGKQLLVSSIHYFIAFHFSTYTVIVICTHTMHCCWFKRKLVIKLPRVGSGAV